MIKSRTTPSKAYERVTRMLTSSAVHVWVVVGFLIFSAVLVDFHTSDDISLLTKTGMAPAVVTFDGFRTAEELGKTLVDHYKTDLSKIDVPEETKAGALRTFKEQVDLALKQGAAAAPVKSTSDAVVPPAPRNEASEPIPADLKDIS
mmetsp:Transcript_16738/g.41182  ORF Transcript_16738/g.41182 Transcript_16738/m.41182 type:complete len:147 (+) Transcript_16738:231-671(+)